MTSPKLTLCIGLVGAVFLAGCSESEQKTNDQGSAKSAGKQVSEDDQKSAPSADIPNPTPDDPDDKLRDQIVGTWRDHYEGVRTMVIRPDGTCRMTVELSGLKATMFARQLDFDIEWTLEDGKFTKTTIGGEPEFKVNLILKAYGDTATERIDELTSDKLVVVDLESNKTFTWTRMESEANEAD